MNYISYKFTTSFFKEPSFFKDKCQRVKDKLKKENLKTYHIHEIQYSLIHIVFDLNNKGCSDMSGYLNCFYDYNEKLFFVEDDDSLNEPLIKTELYRNLIEIDNQVPLQEFLTEETMKKIKKTN